MLSTRFGATFLAHCLRRVDRSATRFDGSATPTTALKPPVATQALSMTRHRARHPCCSRPQTISPSAIVVGHPAPDQGPPESLENRRRGLTPIRRARVA